MKPICSECKHSEILFDIGGGVYFWCKIAREAIPEDAAQDENLECECFVADVDVDD